MITLETERAPDPAPAPSQPVAPAPPSTPRKKKTAQPSTAIPESARREAEPPSSPPLPAAPEDREIESGPPNPSPPEAVSPPRPESAGLPAPLSDEESIRALVQRQSQAFQDKDADRYLGDLVSQNSKLRNEIQNFFNQYQDISVRFAITQIMVQENEAELYMIQTTRLTPKKGREEENRSKVRWGLVKREGGWKIGATEVLEKY